MSPSKMAYAPMSPNAWLRYSLIERVLTRLPHARSFVEVGCGVGALASRLAARYDYVGYEPDQVSFQTAKARIGRGVIVNDFLPTTPTREFDVLGAFEVLEHQADDQSTIAQWRWWIRPGGQILLSVPANPGRFAAADAMAGHYQSDTPPALKDLLRRFEFDDISVWSYGFPLGYLLEFARNLLARRAAGQTYESRTAASGRFYQPNDRLGWTTQYGTAPFRLIQS